jgi:hypothetical protein
MWRGDEIWHELRKCLSSSRRAQRWWCKAWTKIRENSRKGTLNASSDIFARCSKLQTEGTSSEVFLRLDYPYAWDVVDQVGRYKCAVFFPLHSPPAGPFPQDHRDTVFFPLTCQNARNNSILEMIILHPRSDHSRRIFPCQECVDRTDFSYHNE